MVCIKKTQDKLYLSLLLSKQVYNKCAYDRQTFVFFLFNYKWFANKKHYSV